MITRKINIQTLLITGFILFSSCLMNMKAQIPEVHLNINAKNKRLTAVLDDISKQSGFNFTYDASLIQAEKKISLQLTHTSLNTILDTLFYDSYLNFRLIDKNIVIYPSSSGESSDSETLPTKREKIRIRGKITDIQSGEGLPFATIQVQGTPGGIITNLNGEFSVFISTQIKNPVLVASMIGYKNKSFQPDFNTGHPVLVEMEQEVISLQEVIIRYKNPSEAVSQMIRSIPDNYCREHSSMNAYFREYVMKNNKYVNFSEAVIDIAKAPYNRIIQDQVRVIQGRKISTMDAADSVFLKVQSGVNSALMLDIIKNPTVFVSSDFGDYYHLEFRNMVNYQDRLAYTIGFHPKPVSGGIFNGELYIDRENHALLACNFSVDKDILKKEPGRFLIRKSRFLKVRPLEALYHVEYRKTQDDYHVSMVSGKVSFRLRKKKQLWSTRFDIGIEMAVTAVEPGVRKYIPRRERIRAGDIFSERNFGYDPGFWGDYNVIKPEASLEEALIKMGIPWESFEK